MYSKETQMWSCGLNVATTTYITIHNFHEIIHIQVKKLELE